MSMGRIAVDPLRDVAVDDCLARWAHDRGLLELLAAAMGDDRKLGAEALDVLGLATQVALRNQQREVGVLHAGRLDPRVELLLQVLPDRERPRPDHHRPPHWPVVGQLGLRDHLLVPPREILRLSCEDRLGHGRRC
jgi:hypothetical protein